MNISLNLNISIPFKTAKTYRDISFKDARNIVTFSQQVSNYMYFNSGLAITNEKDVTKLIKRIDTSIKNRSGWRIFLDIITFQFIKIFMIKKELPILINRINWIATNRGVLNPNLSDDESDDASIDDSSADPLPKPQIDNWQDNCEFKLDLMIRAYQYFTVTRDRLKATKGNQPQWQKTAKEVDDFFQNRIHRLTTGENIAIPIYYHASRAGTDLIAGSATLQQSSNGAQGPGVYFSNSDESHSGYGPCTFAMDPSQVESCPTTYANHGGACYVTGEEPALWMCAQQDINLDPSKLAYVIVPDDNKTSNEKLKKFWEEGSFFVDPITRPAADWIRTSIKGVHIHSIPKHWTSFISYGIPQRLPTNLQNIVAN